MIGPVSPEQQWEQAGQEEISEEEMEEDRDELEGPSEEGEKVSAIKTPEGPSQKEIEEHMANHIPFRSWCPFCVTGKAVSGPHQARTEGQGQIPVVSIDYAYMGSGQDGEDGNQTQYS